MAKRFFETFPALVLENELKDLFEFTEVTALKYTVPLEQPYKVASVGSFKRIPTTSDICFFELEISSPKFPKAASPYVFVNVANEPFVAFLLP